MGDYADDARDMEEDYEDMKRAHKAKRCISHECPYCDPDFIPFFSFQNLEE